jgi:hypothetical protein
MSDRIAFTGTMETEGRRIRGSVKLAGARTFRNGEWVEVDPNALMKASAANTIARWDHDPAKVLGRVSNNTLTVTRTPEGIDFETAELPHTTYADDALELVRGGYAGGSSFEIEGLRSTFSTDPGWPPGASLHLHQDAGRCLPGHRPRVRIRGSSVQQGVRSDRDHRGAGRAGSRAPAASSPRAGQVRLFETAEAFERKQDLEPASRPRWTTSSARRRPRRRRGSTRRSPPCTTSASGPTRTAKARFERMKLAPRCSASAGSRRRPRPSVRLGGLQAGVQPVPALGQLPADGAVRADRRRRRHAGRLHGPRRVPQPDRPSASRRSAASPASPTRSRPARASRSAGRTNDDTANVAAIATEGIQAASGGADLVFDSIELGAFEYDADGHGQRPARVSLPLLQDAAFDIEGRRGAQARPADRPQAGVTTSPTARARPSRSACSPSPPT